MIGIVKDHDVGKFSGRCSDRELFLEIGKGNIFCLNGDLILLTVEFLDDMVECFLVSGCLPVIPDRNIPRCII